MPNATRKPIVLVTLYLLMILLSNPATASINSTSLTYSGITISPATPTTAAGASVPLTFGLTGTFNNTGSTLVVTRPGEALPFPAPRPLEAGRSPRGVDRGTVITEPDMISLQRWLTGHGFVAG